MSTTFFSFSKIHCTDLIMHSIFNILIISSGTPLICERLSPWVLEKELKTKLRDADGLDDLLDPLWREKEAKNAVLWWNLILAFMRYRLPFTFLLQGSFQKRLISPKPSYEDI